MYNVLENYIIKSQVNITINTLIISGTKHFIRLQTSYKQKQKMQVQVVISMYHTQDYSIRLVLDYALISIFIPRPHIGIL